MGHPADLCLAPRAQRWEQPPGRAGIPPKMTLSAPPGRAPAHSHQQVGFPGGGTRAKHFSNAALTPPSSPMQRVPSVSWVKNRRLGRCHLARACRDKWQRVLGSESGTGALTCGRGDTGREGAGPTPGRQVLPETGEVKSQRFQTVSRQPRGRPWKGVRGRGSCMGLTPVSSLEALCPL